MDILALQYEIAILRNENAYKRVFLHFYKGLVTFAHSYVKQAEVAEEVVSDVMLQLWTMKDALNSIQNLKVYLFTAVRNTAINYLVKSRHYTTWDIDQVAPEHFPGPLTPEELAIGRELKQQFAVAIANLPPKCQMVYKLVREDRFTYREVAHIMEISENTVDRHLNIAMHRLTETLQAHRKNSL